MTNDGRTTKGAKEGWVMPGHASSGRLRLLVHSIAASQESVVDHCVLHLQVLTMVTLSFTLVGALAGLMGMNLYFAVATTPLVSRSKSQLHCTQYALHRWSGTMTFLTREL